MSDGCGAAAERVTTYLGFECEGAHPIITLRSPLDLENWTLPVLELTIVVGAVLALVHAVRRLRRDGDPVNLALWCASLVYLLVIEPPLYFPEWFGLEDEPGFIFAHNVFTVQFMYDRLPLYIVAIYPAMSALAYEVVRATRVFATRGPLVGAICVAFVNQAFYEIFDQLGPELKWWGWDLDNDVNHPLLDATPVNSMWIFASVSFGVLTYLVVRLTGGERSPRGWSLAWRIVVAGALTPVGMVVASIPTEVVGGVALTVELVALGLYGAMVLVQQRRRHEPDPDPGWFVRVFPPLYLLVMVLLWAGALPGYVEENLPYVVACFAVAAATLVMVTPSRRPAPPAPLPETTPPAAAPPPARR